MENTCFIFDQTPFSQAIIDELQLGESSIFLSEQNNESSYHDWTTTLFKTKKFNKLIIPISLLSYTNNCLGLKIALHIRLNYELSIEQRSTAIVFLSDLNIENLLSKNYFDADCNPQHLLLTKGYSYSSFNPSNIKKSVDDVKKTSNSEYQKEVINKLKISSKTHIGKHSIANAWGCYKLALVSGNKHVIEEMELSEKLKTLYAKYLICQNESYSNLNLLDLGTSVPSNRKVLFIDDQGDEGWNALMKKIFSNNLTIVDSSRYKNQETKSFHDFDGFYKECQSHIGEKWDLVISDLRLNPEKEDIDNTSLSANELSGYKLIDQFLTYNEGTQIILFTASNKIWNINAALNRGASSYYVKESPEFNYSIAESQEQYNTFKTDVKKCFSRNYLFDIFEIHKSCVSNGISEYQNTQLNIAFQLLKDSSNQKHLDFAFLSYYQIIEEYAQKKVEKNNDSYNVSYFVEDECVINEDNIWTLTFIPKQGKQTFEYFKNGTEISKKDTPTTLAKVSFVLACKYKKNDAYLKKLGELNRLRNRVAHGEDNSIIKIENIKSLVEIVELFLTDK